MNVNEFNEKYSDYIEDGFEGLEFDHPEVVDYLDQEFTQAIAEDPDFEFAQVKMKFGTSRVYSTSDKSTIWEHRINEIMGVQS
jgi:hypothetical protein